MSRGNAGKYECRCSNRHGIASSEFQVEILCMYKKTKKTRNNNRFFKLINLNLDVEVKATNRTSFIEQKNLLRDVRAHLVSSYENSSLTLTCQIESNPVNEQVTWFYYELSGSDGNHAIIRNQIVLPPSYIWTSRGADGSSFFSHLVLSNLTSNHSGYYSCAISSTLIDSLNRTQQVNSNATYFLLVQCNY